MDDRLYSVVDALTGFQKRHITREQARKVLDDYRQQAATLGWRAEPRVYYRDGSDVTKEMEGC